MKNVVWALAGGSSLAAKELQDVFEERKLGVTLRLLSGDESSAVLSQSGDEAVVIEPLSAEALESAPVVFLAGTPQQSRRALELAAGAGLRPVFIDLALGLEDDPSSRLRAPMVEPELIAAGPGSLQVIAHPAAAVLARFLLLLHRAAGVEQSVITVCEPVSTHGQAGIDEMHQQTVSLLSFKPMPKEQFDAQVAFNLLPRFGESAKASLEHSAQVIERHLATLLGGSGLSLPSLRVIHAPVFHAYVFSVWVRFSNRADAGALAAVFQREGIDVRGPGVEAASNLGVAGQSGFTVSDIALDANCPQAAWFFVAADNLRVTAENAAMVAGLAGAAQ